MAKSKGKTASQIVSESRQELVDQLIQKMKEFRLREMTIAGARTEIDQCNRENYCVYYKGVVEILDRFHINSYKKTFKYILKSKKWFICGNYDDIIKAHR